MSNALTAVISVSSVVSLAATVFVFRKYSELNEDYNRLDAAYQLLRSKPLADPTRRSI